MASTTSTPDRRVHARIATNVALRYGKAEEFSDGELLDISAGGIGISGEKAYPVGTELELRFRSRAAASDLLTLRAVVRHSIPGKRMGLEFLNVPTTDFARTLALVERLSAGQRSSRS